jgi:hypothetical protein
VLNTPDGLEKTPKKSREKSITVGKLGIVWKIWTVRGSFADAQDDTTSDTTSLSWRGVVFGVGVGL